MNSPHVHDSGDSTDSVSAFSIDELGEFDAVALADKIASGEIAPVEAVSSAIQRAKAVNPSLNAIAAKDFERALERARNPQQGLLSGVPTFIKDTDSVEGLPLFMGSETLPGAISASSSEVVEQIESTGLVYLGTTTTPEFGLTGSTENVRFGATRNPWNVNYSTGGSSGGSSAMVAAGVVPIAHANDGAGSIRIPASCCGLIGLKPSRGRLAGKDIPRYLPPNIFHEGVVTRTVRDTVRFYQAAEQARAGDLSSIGPIEGPPGNRLRIALLTEDALGVRCDSQCEAAALEVGLRLQGLGHAVDEIKNPFYAGFEDDFWLLWSHCAFALRYGAAKQFSEAFDASKFQGWAKFLVSHQWRNLHRVPAAFGRLRRFSTDYERFFEKFDVLLTPTLGTTVPKIGDFGPQTPGEIHLERIKRFLPFTKYQNVAGAPAVSLPCSADKNGLPIGVQLASRFGADRLLLELSWELEAASDWLFLSDSRGANL